MASVVSVAACTKYFCQAASRRCSRKRCSHLRPALLCTSSPFKVTTRKLAAKMGTQKKEKNRKERQGKTGDGMGNVKVKGENFYRYAFWRIRVCLHTKTNFSTDLRRRSRSSSASPTARPSAMPRETSPKLLPTSRARRPSPASSPTGSGSITPVSSPRTPSTRSALPSRLSRPTRPRTS